MGKHGIYRQVKHSTYPLPVVVSLQSNTRSCQNKKGTTLIVLMFVMGAEETESLLSGRDPDAIDGGQHKALSGWYRQLLLYIHCIGPHWMSHPVVPPPRILRLATHTSERGFSAASFHPAPIRISS